MSNDTAPATPAGPAWPLLSAVEARVLASLIEKQITTPDYYPLTMGSLIAACNQKSNRDPIMQVEEDAVLAALDGLREKKAVWQVFLAGNRVTKYRHAFVDVFHVPDEAVPLLAELMLRGPQTGAELRTHVERMRPFADVAAVETVLQGLIEHAEGPFVARLAREPGRREARYGHLLCGPAEPGLTAGGPGETPVRVSLSPERERIAALEAEVAALRARLDEIEARLQTFMKQF